MYALTIHDLQTALAASERSDKTLVDLQIDRCLLRMLLTSAIQHEQAQKLYASAQGQNGLFQLIDCDPLPSYSDGEKTQQTPESGPNSVHHNTLSELIRQGAAK